MFPKWYTESSKKSKTETWSTVTNLCRAQKSKKRNEEVAVLRVCPFPTSCTRDILPIRFGKYQALTLLYFWAEPSRAKREKSCCYASSLSFPHILYMWHPARLVWKVPYCSRLVHTFSSRWQNGGKTLNFQRVSTFTFSAFFPPFLGWQWLCIAWNAHSLSGWRHCWVSFNSYLNIISYRALK